MLMPVPDKLTRKNAAQENVVDNGLFDQILNRPDARDKHSHAICASTAAQLLRLDEIPTLFQVKWGEQSSHVSNGEARCAVLILVRLVVLSAKKSAIVLLFALLTVLRNISMNKIAASIKATSQ